MAKILLVEDDNNLREIYEARLQAEGYDIVSARDGEEALTIAMKERPDLIISDVMMPKISGFDMLDIIRSTEETKNAKVIMMTALSQAEDKERATKLGADRYLVKSQVTLEDVAKVAREVLNGESDQNKPEPKPLDVPAMVQVPTATPVPEHSAVPPTPAEPAVTASVAAPAVVTPAPAPVKTSVVPDPPSVVPPTPAPATPTVDETAPIASDPIATDSPTTPVVATPTVESSTSSPALAAITPAKDDVTETPESPLEQSLESEQSAIAAQIESFIDSKKPETTEKTPDPAKNPIEPEPTHEAIPVESAPALVVEPAKPSDASVSVGQKVIQPISDPSLSKSDELKKLLVKESDKEQMAEIAKSVIAENAASVASASADPEFIATPQPIIPHSNGSSIDGVTAPLGTSTTVQPEPKASNSTDPDAIAL